MRTFLLPLLVYTHLLVGIVEAQHPIEVQRAVAAGQYMEALKLFDKMPRRTDTTDSILAAARSAWALGLTTRAAAEFDRALRDTSLNSIARARIYLSKGVLEFQDQRYQVAILQAQKSVAVLEQSDTTSVLRSKAFFLWAESLSKQAQYGEAEAKYIAALDEAAVLDQPQFYFALGDCRLALGKYKEAKENFELVPQDHELTSQAMRKLSHIALATGDHQALKFWLTKGRQVYPEEFLDSWVDYALAQVSIEQNNSKDLQQLLENARSKFPPSDPWLVLLESSVESYKWHIANKTSDQGLGTQEIQQFKQERL